MLRDEWPVTHGLRIPGMARHLLYARHWADPPESVIDYPDCAEPLRVRHHLDDVRRILR
jgi:hypothetical protein